MIIDEVLKYAKENNTKEICGEVIVFKGREKFIKCKNIAEDNQEDFFIIDPEDYAKAEDMGEVVYIVHSHPKTSPNPSEADIIGIENTNIPWIIVNPLTEEYTITKPSGYKAPLVGRKFIHGVLDCYSLIKDYYKEKLNIVLLNFIRQDDWWHKGQTLYRSNFEKAGFLEVNKDSLRLHDVLLICNGSSEPNHGAIYLGNGTMLHHVQGRLSSIDVYGGYWLQNTWKVVRHKDLL